VFCICTHFFHGIYSAVYSYVTLVQLHIYVLIILFVLVAGISLVILGDLGLAVISLCVDNFVCISCWHFIGYFR